MAVQKCGEGLYRGASWTPTTVPAVKEATLTFRLCANCANSGSVRCGGCKQVRYCGADCQKNHWPEHKKTCGRDPAALLAEAGLSGEVGHWLVDHGAYTTDSEIATYAALAKTRPWALRVIAATVLLMQWVAILKYGDEHGPDPRDLRLFEKLEGDYLLIIADGTIPDPDHFLTKDYLLGTFLTGLDDRVRAKLWPATQVFWVTGAIKEALFECSCSQPSPAGAPDATGPSE
jgi:hypothetical protein